MPRTSSGDPERGRRTRAGSAGAFFPSAALALALLGSGCARPYAPRNWLPDAAGAQQDAHGGWIVLHEEDERRMAEGELIAVMQDSVLVMTQAGLVSRPLASTKQATLTAYDAHAGKLATWSLLGTVSTLSHGGGLVISAPIWIIAGAASTSTAVHQAEVKTPKRSWKDMQMYARFPQGIPADLDRTTLHPKPH